MEKWKNIEGYNGIYQISNTGKYRSTHGGRWNTGKIKILKPGTAKGGYFVARLLKGDSFKSKYIHRLVASHFLDNPENKKEVNHKDGDKSNNHIDNLERVTRSENMQHRRNVLGYRTVWETNNPNKGKRGGELHNSIKVNQYTLDGEHIKTWDSIIDITRELGIDNSAISKVCRGKLNKTGGYIFKKILND